MAVKCTKTLGRYICLIDNEPYIIEDITINGEPYNLDELEYNGKYRIEGDTLILEKTKEKFNNSVIEPEDIQFMREYYRKQIPTPEDMKIAKEIRNKANTYEDKQELYFKIMGGRPPDSLCIYDIVSIEDMIHNGYSAHEDKKGNVWGFKKKVKGKNISVSIENYDDEEDEYLIKFIRIYTKDKEISPICVNNKGIGYNVLGEKTND